MNRRIASTILLFIAISIWSVRDAATVTGGVDSVATSMRKLADDIFTAYQKRDTVALKKFYAKQPDALFFWERKMTYSWEELDATIDALVKAAAKLELTTTDFRSGGSGDTGWFAATFHIERVTPDRKQSASDGRWTVIAEKRDGRWLIVHEHTSFPLPKT
ncbi:MAG TPA: nuclear transport factor 2 family protein [Blastocatellia bacterium]|nr:nuclear transport factor 2 family protein [Blastocatellia bacterium]